MMDGVVSGHPGLGRTSAFDYRNNSTAGMLCAVCVPDGCHSHEPY